MEYINFIICIIVVILGVLIINEIEDLGGILLCFGIGFLVLHGYVFNKERNTHHNFIYEVTKHHRLKDLTPEDQDSINETIHYLRYKNDLWFKGQYIPDAIDTLTLFNHKEDNQWEQIIDSHNKIQQY
jgi:hypothetical protein